MNVGLLIAAWGLWLLWRRWHPKGREGALLPFPDWPTVSIVVPARNELRLVPRLLDSLLALDYPQFEVILVDDQSDDGTGDLARLRIDPRLVVVSGAPKPPTWGGKQWACHQGSGVATGSHLLFTDADTVHEPDSLRRAIQVMTTSNAGMMSCLPFHDGTAIWERLSGAFHVLLLTVTAPLAKPRPGRVYAIGQYLLFQRDAYDAIGGHESVKDSLVEDLPLANQCLRKGIRYQVVATGAPFFRVRMYDSLPEFLRGWRRNFRAGLGGSSLLAPLEMTAMIAALAGSGGIAPAVVGVVLVALAQRRLGRFPVWGALAFPWGVALLCAATALAASDMLTGRATVWKGRPYFSRS